MFTREKIRFIFVRALCRRCLLPRRGLPCLVLGAAPDPHLPARELDKINLICVNSSGWCAKQLGLKTPDLTVLSYFRLFGHDIALDMEAIRGLRTHKLLIVPYIPGPTLPKIKDILAKLDYQYDKLETMDHRKKHHVVEAVTGEDLGRGDPNTTKVSTGLLAVCLALYQGASEVIMSGISLTADGHSYYTDRDRWHQRKHIVPDKKAIIAIRNRKCPIKTSEPSLAEETGIMLV